MDKQLRSKFLEYLAFVIVGSVVSLPLWVLFLLLLRKIAMILGWW